LVSIGLFLLPGMPDVVDTVAWWLLIASVALAVVTWVDYEARLSRARKAAADAA